MGSARHVARGNSTHPMRRARRYHGGRNWRRRYKLVLGVVHTNYISYAKLYQPENIGIVKFINAVSNALTYHVYE